MGTSRKHVSVPQKPEAADAMAERTTVERLRMDRHPGIVFREGTAGRRAALAGHRLDVWQIIETLRDSGGDEIEAAIYLGLTPVQVRSAAVYHAEFADEIEGWIDRNAAASEQAEAAWRRAHAATH